MLSGITDEPRRVDGSGHGKGNDVLLPDASLHRTSNRPLALWLASCTKRWASKRDFGPVGIAALIAPGTSSGLTGLIGAAPRG